MQKEEGKRLFVGWDMKGRLGRFTVTVQHPNERALTEEEIREAENALIMGEQSEDGDIWLDDVWGVQFFEF